MALKEKLAKEFKTVFFTSLYFLLWFSAMILIKTLLLREYEIKFYGFASAVVAALAIAKVVLVLEYVPIKYTEDKPAWQEVLVRTILYMIGAFVFIALEKAFHARHEYGSMLGAFANMGDMINTYHLWVNILNIGGAILLFNIWSVVKMHYGKGIFIQLMAAPLPQDPKT